MNNPLVSVVIITRNRAKGLQRCVKSILNNSYKNIELLIFDNSSSEPMKRNEEFLSSLEFKSVKYIKSSPKGFAEMRQIAIENSEGKIIMSIDDDCVAGKEAIKNIVQRFQSKKSIGVVGGSLTNVGFPSWEKFKGRGKITTNGQYEVVEDPQEADIFGSANMSTRKEAFDAVGGYDLFFRGGLEEADLCLSIKESGFEIVYEPSVKITHYHHPSRFRPKGRNLDVLRLYLFFKHFMPRDWEEWLLFGKNELELFVEELKALLPQKNSAGAEKEKRKIETHMKVLFIKLIRATHARTKMLMKLISARIKIPWIIYRAKRTA